MVSDIKTNMNMNSLKINLLVLAICNFQGLGR